MLCPSVRAAASRMTCSAARITSLVCRRDPATSYTLVPSARRNGSDHHGHARRVIAGTAGLHGRGQRGGNHLLYSGTSSASAKTR